MTTTPSALALATIADGSAIVAADHRNNYAAVQAAVNALISGLTGAAAGQVAGLTTTTIVPVYPPGYEFGYVQIVTQPTVNVNVAASATTLMTFSPATFDGAPVMLEFFGMYGNPFDALVSTCTISLWEGAGEIARFARVQNETATANANIPIIGRYRFTPSAAAHTYIIKAFATTGRWLIASTATDAAFPPIFARITKV